MKMYWLVCVIGLAGLMVSSLIGVNPAVGDTVWTQVPMPGAPPSIGGEMVYHTVWERVVFFGGESEKYTACKDQVGDSGWYGKEDIWEWDGSSWASVEPATGPAPMIDHALAYDARRDVIVLFGGTLCSDIRSCLNDTWEWDGHEWALRTPETSPDGRYHSAMVYDARRGVVVLFGGFYWPNWL